MFVVKFGNKVGNLYLESNHKPSVASIRRGELASHRYKKSSGLDATEYPGAIES
jgi:hypothetical protein